MQSRQSPGWHWRDAQLDMAALWPREEPKEPQIGQGWFDERTGCLYIWDGRSWVCASRD